MSVWYRVGKPNYGDARTVADLVRYEREIGNTDSLTDADLTALDLIPVVRAVWLCKTVRHAQRYGTKADIRLWSVAQPRILIDDGDHGYLVLEEAW